MGNPHFIFFMREMIRKHCTILVLVVFISGNLCPVELLFAQVQASSNPSDQQIPGISLFHRKIFQQKYNKDWEVTTPQERERFFLELQRTQRPVEKKIEKKIIKFPEKVELKKRKKRKRRKKPKDFGSAGNALSLKIRNALSKSRAGRFSTGGKRAVILSHRGGVDPRKFQSIRDRKRKEIINNMQFGRRRAASSTPKINFKPR